MFYIGTGTQTKMYTLRERFNDTVWFKGEGGNPQSSVVVRDWYIQNLSTDKDKAIAKAEAMGHKITNPDFELQDIIRRNEEQMLAAKAKAEEEAGERQFRFGQKQLHQITEALSGTMPFGKHRGKLISHIILGLEDFAYGRYWLVLAANEDSDPVVQAVASYIDTRFPQIRELMIEKVNGSGEFYSEPKVRTKSKEVTLIASFFFETYFGITYIEKYLCDGALLVYKGSTPPDMQLLDTRKADFTVKEHTVYKDVNQTFIQRIKLHEQPKNN